VHPRGLANFILILASLALTASKTVSSRQPQEEGPPFRMPLEGDPGPSTWLLGQPYGNTEFAYRSRYSFYSAGQGLHFGIDLSAPCGTTVVAIGDGVVSEVDNPYHGAGPHSLMIDHPNGYASFYGHLRDRPALRRGDAVTRGQSVAVTGDPDETCTSRPHLHLEIRNAPSHTIAFNPVLLVEAEWDRIALVGAQALGFEQDLAAPQRWQSLFDQPETLFGHPLINDYVDPWPPAW
jgi:murein DD-endopeptidase MepM/ murein hydrolase activator NlpD